MFDVAAGVLGLDARKDFPAVVQAVADTVGYVLRDDSVEKPKQGHRKRKNSFPRVGGICTASALLPVLLDSSGLVRPVDKPLEYLPPDEEAAALDAVRRAAASPDVMAWWADRLGLPLDVVMIHTDIQAAAARGLLGLDDRGRLLYVYTHSPAAGEPVRVVGVKTRSLPGVEPRFLMRGGLSMPWGWDDVDSAGCVYVTEGESDALAVRAALGGWLDWVAKNEPDSYPNDNDIPAVIAKPGAGTFRESWACRLVGKDVVLVADNDDAGRKGAEKTAGILRAAGVRRIFIWVPTDGVKDARAALDAVRPWLLADDILENKKELTI